MGTASGGFKAQQKELWFPKDGSKVMVKDMHNTHLLHTIVKIERDKKRYIGQNDTKRMLPILLAEVTYRGLHADLDKQRIEDAKKHGDVRRLVNAVAEKEKRNVSAIEPPEGGVS